ncbi:gamma-glutamylcyclotransferase [Pseudorhodobacter wandonensis]|uniref:gamma-glutamylcyclotransferase n=1 Tax=Pseudorhodobacter wandonensis TaxID=1120568 RepID=UPI00067C9BE8|nr:gamma-glutamylcyclotransferase [Pseudorhodobacter wandonensis]
MTEPLFIYGTLCHPALLHLVLGRVPVAVPARLADHAVHWAEGHDFPLIIAAQGGEAEGLLLTDLTAEDVARLDYYEGPFGYSLQPCTVRLAGDMPRPARVYVPDPGLWQPGAAWRLDDWVTRFGEIIVTTAADVMALYPAPIAPSRRWPMLVRGASRVRAAQAPANGLRRVTQAADVAVQNSKLAYADFFGVEEYFVSFQKFDGKQSPVVKRAVFVSGDAVTVLPYDPVRDRVLCVEQFRVGPFARGDVQPWQLEPIAGRIDPFETAEVAARREAVEEAGLNLGALLPIGGYYPTPGAKTEYIYSYIALTDLPDGAAILGGEPSEAEDIKGHILPFTEFAALVARGEATTGPLLISYFWLERERPRLMAEAARTGL